MSERKPLTLEELRKMIDKPAYLDVFDKALQSGWHIIKAVTKDKIVFRGWNTVYVPIEAMGKDYNLYDYEPPRLNRSAWEPCEWCGTCENCQHATAGENETPCCYCLSTEGGIMNDFNPAGFCKYCGRPLTDAAWEMLEKKLRGDNDD